MLKWIDVRFIAAQTLLDVLEYKTFTNMSYSLQIFWPCVYVNFAISCVCNNNDDNPSSPRLGWTKWILEEKQ